MARRVLAARGRVLGAGAPPLLVIGPRPLRPVLAAQAALEPLPFTFVDCASTEAGAADAGCGGAAVSAALAAANLASLTSVRVVHCAHAFGVVLVGRAGWKLAFSGDTRPCDALVRRARSQSHLLACAHLLFKHAQWALAAEQSRAARLPLAIAGVAADAMAPGCECPSSRPALEAESAGLCPAQVTAAKK